MENIELLNKDEAAKIARTTPGTLMKLVGAGIGPNVTRIGSRVFFQAQDLAHWIKSRSAAPGISKPQA